MLTFVRGYFGSVQGAIIRVLFPDDGRDWEMRGVKLIETEGWQGKQQIRLFPFWRRDNMGA